MPSAKKPTNTTALVNTLTDSAALPALIEKLEPRALQQLIETVGVEDAGALVVHASAKQMAHLIDESVWASVNPGEPESLSVHELLRWFELWVDIGDSFAADKLFDLGEEFCALTLAKLVVVGVSVSTDELPFEFTQVLGSHLVSARFDDEWDTVRTALVALRDDYPDFLEAILNRLNFRHSILGISGEDDLQTTIEADASYERETRKEAKGFVGTATAGAFLHELAQADLDSLVDEQTYDPHTAAYLQRRTRKTPRQDEPTVEEDPQAQASAKTETTDAELDALQRELEQYDIVRDERLTLLTGPEQSNRVKLPIRLALASLVTDAECFEARSDELVYLSNLVKTSVTLDASNISEATAANAVLATCNLGGSYLLWLDARESQDTEADSYLPMLATEPGLVGLFRIGWNLLQRLPVQSANRLSQALWSDATRETLSGKPWLLEEVDALLHQPNLVQMVKERQFASARDTLNVLTIVLQPAAVIVLNLLIDDMPRLAKSLEGDHGGLATAGTQADESRYIESTRDLFLLDKFFSQLVGQVKA